MFLEYLNHLRSTGRRYFTFTQITDDLKISANSAKSGLYRMRRQGNLITPAKGFYVIIPPEYQPLGSIPPEELVPILMRHLKVDYYVSLLSGGQYHGATHQRPGRFQVISNKRMKHPLDFGQIKIEMIYKKSLAGLPLQDVVVKTGYLKVATPELVALDLLHYVSKSGGLSHIATVFSELIEEIDANKLIELAKATGENAWLQRMGFILERIDFMDEDNARIVIRKLERYLRGKIKAFIPLATKMPKAGFPRNKKWMVIENTNIESDL